MSTRGWFGITGPLAIGAFAVCLGGFASGAQAKAVGVGSVFLLLLAALGAAAANRGPHDPLSLGQKEPSAVGLMPWLLLLAVAVSWLLSPVPRAGMLVLCYGPWLLLLAPAFAWMSRSAAMRRWLGFGLCSGVLVVAAWALIDWRVSGYGRAAMPLGHHNLLALWLVALLPLCVLPRRWRANLERSDAHGANGLAALEMMAFALGLLALLGTRSLAGASGFAAQIMLFVWVAPGTKSDRPLSRRLAAGLLVSAAVVAAVGWRRLGQWATSSLDSSTQARWEYLKGGFAGFLERPWWGHGPGSSAWLLGEYVDGGGLPAHQIVTDAHSLPFDLLFEIGIVGLVLVIGTGLLWWRARILDFSVSSVDAEQEAWARSADIGLVGLLVTSCFAGYFDVLAIWILLPLLCGIRLGSVCAEDSRLSTLAPRWPRVATMGLVFALGLICLGPTRAQFAYERALDPFDPAVLEHAVELDPQQPLYDWLLARSRRSAELADGAASTARGLFPLALSAGAIALDRGQHSTAVPALVRACDLSVHDPFAPFLLATARDFGPLDPNQPTDAQHAALEALERALLGEPRLLASPELLARPDVRRLAVRLLSQRADVSLGWRAALVQAETRLPKDASGVHDPVELVLHADGEGEVSLSLFAFRRRPFPAELARITLSSALAETITMPPAALAGAIENRPWARGCRMAVSAS